MNQEQAMSILTRIAAAYPRFELTTDAIGKERIKLWLDHLKDQPYEQVLKKLTSTLLKEISTCYRRDQNQTTRAK